MHSKKYKNALLKIDKQKQYSLAEAIDLVKQTAKTKFDGSVEVHLNLGIDTKKGEQSVRGSVILPHGTGKIKKVAVFATDEKQAKEAGADVIGSEELIKNIVSTGKIDFDVAIATPEMMKKLAGAAKVLGPRGLMPSPKAGTLVDGDKLKQTVEEIKKGKVAFKNDESGNLHQIIGKISWESQKIKENFNVFLDAVKQAEPAGLKGYFIKSLHLTSTMGPAVKVEVE